MRRETSGMAARLLAVEIDAHHPASAACKGIAQGGGAAGLQAEGQPAKPGVPQHQHHLAAGRQAQLECRMVGDVDELAGDPAGGYRRVHLASCLAEPLQHSVELMGGCLACVDPHGAVGLQADVCGGHAESVHGGDVVGGRDAA